MTTARVGEKRRRVDAGKAVDCKFWQGVEIARKSEAGKFY